MRRNQTKIALLLAALLVLTACGGAAASESSAVSEMISAAASEGSEKSTEVIPGLTKESYPRVDGSTANMPLMAQVYSTVCGVSLEEAETAVEVTSTSPSWRGLMNKESDLLLVYEPSENVKAELAASDVKLESIPIGRDGLVFLVNTDNKLDGLTQDQLRDIYTGKNTDWSDVGGDIGPIAAFQRDAESGSQTLFEKLLMRGVPPMEAPSELVPGFMSDLVDGIATFDGSGGAIGYSVFYYAKEMYAKPNLKLFAVDGVVPSSQSIGDGSYPLVNDFYVVIRADEPEGSPARRLRDWLLTEDGRETLIAGGYVPAPQG